MAHFERAGRIGAQTLSVRDQRIYSAAILRECGADAQNEWLRGLRSERARIAARNRRIARTTGIRY